MRVNELKVSPVAPLARRLFDSFTVGPETDGPSCNGFLGARHRTTAAFFHKIIAFQERGKKNRIFCATPRRIRHHPGLCSEPVFSTRRALADDQTHDEKDQRNRQAAASDD